MTYGPTLRRNSVTKTGRDIYLRGFRDGDCNGFPFIDKKSPVAAHLAPFTLGLLQGLFADSEKTCQTMQDSDKGTYWAVIEKLGRRERLLGFTGLILDTDDQRLHLLIALAKPGGVGGHVAPMRIAAAFSGMGGRPPEEVVVASIGVENEASLGLTRKMGGVFVGYEEKHQSQRRVLHYVSPFVDVVDGLIRSLITRMAYGSQVRTECVKRWKKCIKTA